MVKILINCEKEQPSMSTYRVLVKLSFNIETMASRILDGDPSRVVWDLNTVKLLEKVFGFPKYWIVETMDNSSVIVHPIYQNKTSGDC